MVHWHFVCGYNCCFFGISFWNLERYLGSGNFRNIQGKCFIFMPDIAKFLLNVPHDPSSIKNEITFTRTHLKFDLQEFWNRYFYIVRTEFHMAITRPEVSELVSQIFSTTCSCKVLWPPGKWRHNIGSVKLKKILKFAVSVIFRDSSPPANFFFCVNLH